MKQEILAKFPWPTLPSLALIVFFTFFVCLFVITYMRSKTPLYTRAAAIPLDDEVKES